VQVVHQAIIKLLLVLVVTHQSHTVAQLLLLKVVAVVLIMHLMAQMEDVVVEVPNLIEQGVHQFSHHKTLEFQVFNSLVMLVGRVVNITVVQLDLVVEAVPEVLVV
jgi:hypothetical protein